VKTIAILDADLDVTPLGTRSRLAEPLGGVPVLRRTVDRLLRCRLPRRIIVLCPSVQRDRAAQLLDGADVDLRQRDSAPPPYRSLVRVARKWSLDAWRGGLGGSSALDEYADAATWLALAKSHGADSVVSLQPGAACIDPELVDAMIRHSEERSDEVRMTFAQAPPGLAPSIYQTALCEQLAAARVPPGWTLAYKPDDPKMDLAFKPCCFPMPMAVRHASGRLTADTARSFNMMGEIIAAGADRDAESTGRWLLDFEANHVHSPPREVEIELTTRDTLPEALLRPCGVRVPARGPLALESIDNIVAALGTVDDALVVLGGHGDPALHPQFDEVLARLRGGGVYGLTVNTTGQQLSDEVIAAMVKHRVDVVVFMLDAWTADMYAKVSGGASLDAAKDAMNRLAAARQSAKQAEPVIVPRLIKSTENLQEMDAFFDGWMRAIGCATIIGYSDFGGRMPDLAVADMSPNTREPCRRIMNRCVVLADGTVTACDQDFAGQLAYGHLGEGTMLEIWHGARARRLRQLHRDERPQDAVLCGPCAEWHRP
jgi:hypothetical protein